MFKLYEKIYGSVSRWGIFKKLQGVKLFAPYLTEQGLWQFVKYFLVGVGTALLELLLFAVFQAVSRMFVTDNASISITALDVVANTVGTTIAFLLNFALNRKLSFKSSGKVPVQFIKYILLFLFNMVFTNIMLAVIPPIGIHTYIVKLFCMVMIVFWNFFIYKKFIFK